MSALLLNDSCLEESLTLETADFGKLSYFGLVFVSGVGIYISLLAVDSYLWEFDWNRDGLIIRFVVISTEELVFALKT